MLTDYEKNKNNYVIGLFRFNVIRNLYEFSCNESINGSKSLTVRCQMLCLSLMIIKKL